MKRLILFATLIFITEFSFSQTDFRNGYIITTSGDTLQGLVDYRERAKTYKSCDFKASNDQNTITYPPGSIMGYGFQNDKFFQSREISIKDQPSQVVFLEVIVRGAVSLFKFESTFFIEKGNEGLQQLINETNQVVIDGVRVEKKSNQHIGTINILVFDCPEIRSRVQKIGLNEKGLTNLIEDYNRCKGVSSFTFKAKKPWTKAIIGLTGGLNVAQLEFDTEPSYQHLTGNFDVSESPMIGVSFDIFSPRLSERFSFHGDLLYFNSKNYSYTVYNNLYTVERNYVTIELQQFKVPIGIRYTFPKRQFNPYFSLGISSTIHLSSNSNWIQEVESNYVVNIYEREALTMKNKQFGLWGGFGMLKSIHNKFNAFLEFRYEQTDGILPFSFGLQEYSSKISNFQILIGLRSK